MCGILGVISDSEVQGDKFSEALNEVRSRGPDDEGYVCLESSERFHGEDSIRQSKDVSTHSSGKWLGHRRLSVTGGDGCRQPMKYGKYWLVYEGEIYNFRDVREELRDLGHDFETDGDTEVFLKSYIEWGEDALRRFEGKWAAAIYNEEEKSLTCLTDHFGTKPIYYVENDGLFCFSSQIRPLIELKNSDPEVDKVMRKDYLSYSLVDHTERTFFEDVKRLRSGQKLVFQSGQVRKSNIGLPQAPDSDLRDEISSSIKSKVPESEWCVILSGGLDSSIVTSLLADEDPDIFSANITEEDTYESEARKELADEYDLDINEIDISSKEMISEVRSQVKNLERPASILPEQAQNILLRKISQEGYKVVINGSGADEFFFGYDYFLPIAISEKFRNEGLLPAIKLFRQYRGDLGLVDALYIMTLTLSFHPREAIFGEKNDRMVSRPEGYTPPSPIEDNPSSLDAARDKHIYGSWYPSILTASHKNSGANGLEVREGFLSSNVFALLKQRDPLENFHGGYKKFKLRELFSDILPSGIACNKKKHGFVVTNEAHLTEEVQEELLSVIDSQSFQEREGIDSSEVLRKARKGKIDFQRLYRFYSYELWAREFLD